LFVPAIVSYFVVLADPNAAYAIAPPQLIESVHHHQLWTHIPPDARVEAGGLIMINNIWVSMLAFAFGVLFGLPVIWVRQGKTSLALGNISGAMMIQATVPSALGLFFTPWHLDPALLLSAGVTAAAVLYLFFAFRGGLVSGARLAQVGWLYLAFGAGLLWIL